MSLKNDLEKYENQKKEGGTSSLKGYNFQAYVGIYYMFTLYKNAKKFKIFFEKDDDIVLETDNKKYKIQCKTSTISLTYISKKKKHKSLDIEESIVEKLISKKEFYKYVLAFPLEKYSKELKNQLDEVDDEYIGLTCFKLKENPKDFLEIFSKNNVEINSFIFQEIPFSHKVDNAFCYLKGHLSNSNSKKMININDDQLNALLGAIMRVSSKETKDNYFTDEKILNIENINENDKILDGILDGIFSSENIHQKYILKARKGMYFNNKMVIEKKLSKCNLKKYSIDISPKEFFFENLENLKNKETGLDFFEISWYILDTILKVILEEVNKCGYIN